MTYRDRSEGAGLRIDEFRLLRDFVNSHAGLYFNDVALPQVERKLLERLEALGLVNFGEYYAYLRFHDPQRAELLEALHRLTTKETYFFRQEYQLRAFSQELLPRLARQLADRKSLTVWSAGCATGEEVYTLAILIRESGLFHDWSVRVIGSDISKPSLSYARRAQYQEHAFRATASKDKAAYFTPEAGGHVVLDEIRAFCQFGHVNLLDIERQFLIGRVDVVFCRNVLIYFDMYSRQRVIQNLYERLLPGGYLLLGHSESLLNLTTAFELVHLKDDLLYRKPTPLPRME